MKRIPVKRMPGIGYISEHDEEYSKGLYACHTLVSLRKFMNQWRPLAADAFEVVMTWDEEAFKAFRRGLAKESKGKYAGDNFAKKYSAGMLPEVLFLASLVAEKYKAPWGTAFLQMERAGLIAKEKGVYVVKQGVEVVKQPQKEGE